MANIEAIPDLIGKISTSGIIIGTMITQTGPKGEPGKDGKDAEIVTSNYEELNNLPQINGVDLVGNKKANELRLQETMRALTNLELEEIFK